jgi:hypothetical protein
MINIINSQWDDKGIFTVLGFSPDYNGEELRIKDHKYGEYCSIMSMEYFYYLIVDTSSWLEPIYDIDVLKLVLAHQDINNGEELSSLSLNGINYKNYTRFRKMVRKFYKPKNVIYD